MHSICVFLPSCFSLAFSSSLHVPASDRMSASLLALAALAATLSFSTFLSFSYRFLTRRNFRSRFFTTKINFSCISEVAVTSLVTTRASAAASGFSTFSSCFLAIIHYLNIIFYKNTLFQK